MFEREAEIITFLKYCEQIVLPLTNIVKLYTRTHENLNSRTGTLLAGHPPSWQNRGGTCKEDTNQETAVQGKEMENGERQGQSFILKLLEKNAKRRLASDRAMRDPWIRELRTKSWI